MWQWKQGRVGHAATYQETPGATQSWERLGRTKRAVPWSPPRSAEPYSLTGDFCSPNCERKRLLFPATKYVFICYPSPRKLVEMVRKTPLGGRSTKVGPGRRKTPHQERDKLVVEEQWGNASCYIRDERKKSLECNLGWNSDLNVYLGHINFIS